MITGIKDESYRFTISVSTKSYDHKPTGTDYKMMKFSMQQLSVTELMDMITVGHVICHRFNGDRRLKDEFAGTCFICVDMDEVSEPMETCIDRLSMLPTLAYTTCSNGIRGNRYRLIYVFDSEISSAAEFSSIYHFIVTENQLISNDDCGSRCNQPMNGNPFSTVQTYASNVIYSLHSIKSSLVQNSSLDLLNNTPYTPQHSKSKEHKWTCSECSSSNINIFDVDCSVDIIDRLFALDDLRYGCKYFLEKYNYIAWIVETALIYNEKGYSLLDDDYRILPTRYKWSRDESGKSTVSINRYKDREHRRYKLYSDACIMRLINPNASYLSILVNLLRRVNDIYDNSDGVLTTSVIIDKVDAVMSLDINDISCGRCPHGKFKVSKDYCATHGTSPRRYCRTVQKWLNQQAISEWYDSSKSISDNLRFAQENNIKVCRSTLKRYCQDCGINPNPKQLPISSWYDVHISSTANLQMARQMGIKVSKAALYKYCKANGINTKGQQPTTPSL